MKISRSSLLGLVLLGGGVSLALGSAQFAEASCHHQQPIVLQAGDYNWPNDAVGNETCITWETVPGDPPTFRQTGSEQCPNIFRYAGTFYMPCSGGTQPLANHCCVDTTIAGQILYALCNSQGQGGGCSGSHGAAQNVQVPSGSKMVCDPANLSSPCGSGATEPVPDEDDKTPPQ